MGEENWVEDSLNVGKTALLFFFLVLGLAHYGNELSQSFKKSQPGPFSDKQVTKRKLDVVTGTLMFSFATRVIRDIIAAAGWGSLDVDSEGDFLYQLVLFLMYFTWEIIPIVMVLWMCGFVPKVIYRTHSEDSTPILHKRGTSFRTSQEDDLINQTPSEEVVVDTPSVLNTNMTIGSLLPEEIRIKSGSYEKERGQLENDLDDDDDYSDDIETARIAQEHAVLSKMLNNYPTESPLSQSFPRWPSEDTISFPNSHPKNMAKSQPDHKP